ncbi:hypothetical protein Sjap_008081 [Stephania japonica]|uniref:Uncharacterized protein n=1 Tax=Stephania japonica TaxID=461633 RepID=A0AAP0JNY3_9MAGN
MNQGYCPTGVQVWGCYLRTIMARARLGRLLKEVAKLSFIDECRLLVKVMEVENALTDRCYHLLDKECAEVKEKLDHLVREIGILKQLRHPKIVRLHEVLVLTKLYQILASASADHFKGPLVASVLQHLTKEDLSKLYFEHFKIIDINGAHCFLTRIRFFADLVNYFGSYANDFDKVVQEILRYVFYFLVVGVAIWASGWAGIS